jgi:hypothetical protein
MKQTTIIILILALAFVLGGCSMGPSVYAPGIGNKYVYTYKMINSAKPNELLFRDENIVAQFGFDEGSIHFQLQNLSYSDICIQWNKAAISFNGEYMTVRHKENLYTDTASTVLYSAMIPPMGFVCDLVLPRKNMVFDGQEWTEKDFLLTRDYNNPKLKSYIQQSVGKVITVLLPIQIGQQERKYEFRFQVASVKNLPWKDYMPIRGVPSPHLRWQIRHWK